MYVSKIVHSLSFTSSSYSGPLSIRYIWNSEWVNVSERIPTQLLYAWIHTTHIKVIVLKMFNNIRSGHLTSSQSYQEEIKCPRSNIPDCSFDFEASSFRECFDRGKILKQERSNFPFLPHTLKKHSIKSVKLYPSSSCPCCHDHNRTG